MKQLWTWIAMIGGGASIVVIGSILQIDKILSVMMAAMGLVVVLMPIIQIFGQLKKARVIPFLIGTKENEHITLCADRRNRLSPILMTNKYEGVLHKKGAGIMEDKGTPLTWADTGIPISVSNLKSGTTIDLMKAQYTSQLAGNGLLEYEDAIKKYLGPAKYTNFCKTFREKVDPDYNDIVRELNHLLNEEPNDPLAELVIGETINFKDFLGYLKYIYTPLSTENAIDAEIIQTRREAAAYKDAKSMQGWGKIILVVLIGVGILLVLLAAVGPNLGSMFGGGA